MAQQTLVKQARRLQRSARVRDYLTVWVVVLLMSGQGFRHLLGLPAYGVLSVLTVVAVAVTFHTTRKRLNVPFLIAAFVGLAALSVTWSGTRTVSALAVGVLLATTYIAVATVRGASSARFMELLYRGMQISLFAGVAFEVVVAFIIRTPVLPLFRDLSEIDGVDDGVSAIEWSDNLLLAGGPIQGFVGNRNPFGTIALFAAVLAIVLVLEGRIKRTDAWATAMAAFSVHLLTLSATVTVSIIYLSGLLLAALVIRSVREPFKRPLSFATLALTAVAGVLTIKFRDEIFALVDRGPDATNRTAIWDEVVHFAAQRPEGWGYVGYWPVWEHPYSSISEQANKFASHSHNAYLDAWLQLGLVGLALLLVMVVVLFGSMWRLVERADRADTYIPIAWALLTAALVLQALTESRLLVEGGWYLLVALYCTGPQLFKLTMVDPDLVHSAAAIEAPLDQAPSERLE